MNYTEGRNKMETKTKAVFSMPLFKQTCKSNLILTIAILLVMCMMANVTNYAMSIMAKETKSEIDENIMEELYSYINNSSGGESLGRGQPDSDEIANAILSEAGISTDNIDKMKGIDFTVFFNKIYFTVIGMLPPFIFIIIAAYMLIAGQVDKGSMAYILSTPTKRSAVAITEASYMIIAPLLLMSIVCVVRCISTKLFFGEVNIPRTILLYLGMYLVTEAAAGICYMFSCIFNQSSKSLGVGGGITVWFFLASLLGMFGSEDLVNMGVGAEILNIFNKLTIISLFDATAVQTIETSSVDTGFIPGMIILIVISATCYIAGAVKFCKKDLPL